MKTIVFSALLLITAVSSNSQNQPQVSKPKVDSVKQLKGISITGQKPLIESKMGKMVLNVDRIMSSSGASILDALSSAPNVDVDNNGIISVKGKGNAAVYIDGRLIHLSGQDLASYLKGIPASHADQVEVMTQPSAKYEASSNAGIINIILKKKPFGLNASVSTNDLFSNYSRSQNSFAVNYRKGKWNTFLNGSLNYIQNYTKRQYTRSSDNSSSIFRQDEGDRALSTGNSLSGGFDFNNKSWTLSMLASLTTFNRVDHLSDSTAYNDMNNSGKLTAYSLGTNEFYSPWNNREVAVNIKKTVSKKLEISGDVDYEKYHFNSHQISSTYNYDAEGNLRTGLINPYNQKTNYPSDIQIISLKTDMSYTMGKSKWESGLKSSFIQSDNINNFYSMINDTFKLDNNLSNSYTYKENINAAYLNFNHSFNHISLQTGLRAEQTNTQGFVQSTAQSFSRSYLQLFPTLFINDNLDKNNLLTFSYGRRINRPNYLDLNPFTFLVDQYTRKSGNPYLSPYFTNNFQVDYNYKQKLQLSANYTTTTGIIDDIIVQNDTSKAVLQTRANLNKLINFGISLNYNTKLGNWGTLIISDDLYNNRFISDNINGLPLDNNVTCNALSLIQQSRFKKNWSTEINFAYSTANFFSPWNYRGPRIRNAYTIGKDFSKGKLNIKFKLTDPFNIEHGTGKNDFGNIHSTMAFKEESRRVGFSLSYRFQKGLKGGARKIYTPEEKSRVQ